MKIEELLELARKTWPQKMSEQEIAVAMGVVYGDICQYVRDHSEDKDVNVEVLKKELGNIIFSTIRWCDDLGLDPNECIELAKATQERYASKP